MKSMLAWAGALVGAMINRPSAMILLLTFPRYVVRDGRGRAVRGHRTKRVAQIHAWELAKECRRDQEITVMDTDTGREVAECDWAEEVER